MEIYARNNPDVVSLSQGIPFLSSDASIREEAVKAIVDNKADFYSDPQGIIELRKMISENLRSEGMDFGEDEIMVTAGATEGISSILLSVLSGDRNEVIVPTPCYAAYFRIIELAKGKTVGVKLDEESDWSLDVDVLKSKLSKRTGAILLCNPNNPTGSIYSKEVLREICDIAIENNILVLMDEVYRNMIFDDNMYYSPSVECRYRKNVVRIVSFSKDFSLTGWRVGFIHADRDLIKRILPVHDSLINCVPVVSQYAAIGALRNQDRILAEGHDIYYKNRSIMKGYLDEMGDFFEYNMPRGSYFFFPKFLGKLSAEEFCEKLLRESRVAIVPGADFGSGGEGYVRLCFGRSEIDIREGMSRIMGYFKVKKDFQYETAQE